MPVPPAASGQGETGVLLRLRIIPLESPVLSLPETRLILAGSLLKVPALELRINTGYPRQANVKFPQTTKRYLAL